MTPFLFKNIDHKNEQWKPIASIILKGDTSLRELLTDDSLRRRLCFFCIYIIFFVVSAVMSAINMTTSWKLLTLSTIIFAGTNLINALLSLISRTTEILARVLFAAESILLFTFFLICGEPEGFSAIWAALLPACGLLLYGVKLGAIISSVQYIILLFLFWTEIGNSLLQFSYTESFLFRFPLLYAAFFCTGVFFEGIRAATQEELTETRSNFEYLYRHDSLTGIYNRYGFNQQMDLFLDEKHAEGYAFAIVDLDHFKRVNDSYGHQNGDLVLQQVAKDLVSQVASAGTVCRWGGEEFAILLNSAESAQSLCESLLQHRRSNPISLTSGSYTITISIGLLEITPGLVISAANLVNLADANLYEAKNTGRDKIVTTRL